MPSYAPPGPVLTDPFLYVSRFLNSPEFVPERLRTLLEQRFRGLDLLRGRAETDSGSIGYETIEGIYADAPPEIVAPGAEYTMTTVQDGPAGLARVVKSGKGTIITDEAIKRRRMDPVEKAMLKLANSQGQAIDQSIVSLIASAVTRGATAGQPAGYTGTAATKWTQTGSALILRDILAAKAAIMQLNLGYMPNALLVDDLVWSALASDPTIATAMSREDKTNPIYSGKYEVIGGLEIIPTPSANLPGGAGSAWVLDTTQLGFVVTEDLGGGYQQVNEIVQSQIERKPKNDAWEMWVRSNFAPVVTDPLAGYRINGVS